MLRAEGLHKTYTMPHATLHILTGVGLDVAAGETLAVVGISGAGKSTLLHVLGGLDRPDDGRVFFDDADLYAQSEAKRTKLRARQIGFVFQSYHLLPEMDVLDNVTIAGMALGGTARGAALRRRARELLEAVGLGARCDHRPVELSGGEQQRVAVARALMNQPRLVLADEPTGNLDEETGRHVLDGLFELTRSGGNALVMVTHDPQTAARCDRTLRLVDGVLVQG
jgi:predicted ABC-type transport system involved in lysophospholipase L1 biosynthesis ATPase subunit